MWHVWERGEKCIQILVGEAVRKRPLRRPMHGWKDNIRMDLKEIGWEVVRWLDLAQGRGQWRVT
jgi:hypothetical protein